MSRPIPTPAPDVLAILREIEANGTGKTQFRRVIETIDYNLSDWARAIQYNDGSWSIEDGPYLCSIDDLDYDDIKVPYAAGDLLWVQEAWCLCGQMNDVPVAEMSKYEPVGYLADGNIRIMACSMISQGHTRPSTQMPRWASRITLEVVDVRVQRSQDITLGDIRCEFGNASIYDFAPVQSAISAFQDDWNATQGKPRKNRPDTSWDANPWVAAVTFKPVLQNVDGVTT